LSNPAPRQFAERLGLPMLAIGSPFGARYHRTRGPSVPPRVAPHLERRPQQSLMHVALESPRQPDVTALIAELDAYQDTLYPAEARYALDLDSLAQPNVLFVVARSVDDRAIGCGAVVLGNSYGEVKRMYVRPEVRGKGTARQIIDTLESAACARGCQTLMLETGPYQPEALAFYARQGYTRCGPFGDYPDHPLSVFLRKDLPAEQAAAKADA
jgi:putative acetyltransferase